MLNNKRFQMLSTSLDAINKENEQLKRKVKALETLNHRQAEKMEFLQGQLDKFDNDNVIRVNNRKYAKRINELELIVGQYQRKLKAVREKCRHAFEMAQDDIKAK